MITLTINGEKRTLEAGISVDEFLARRGLHPKMVVVELNGRIIPRDVYAECVLDEGDALEVVQMMAGG